MNAHNFLINRINKKIALSLPYKGRVIDLGCGSTPFKDHILGVADEYIGVDWDQTMHDQNNVDVFADLSKEFPFPAQYADTIISFQVLEHLPEPDLFFSECHRVLRGNGSLFITVPFMWHIHEAPYDYFRFTRYGLDYLLKKHRFVDIEIKENTGFWQMWMLKFNYYTLRFAPGFMKIFWMPIWFLSQAIAVVLDKLDYRPQETASYTVRAKKIDDA